MTTTTIPASERVAVPVRTRSRGYLASAAFVEDLLVFLVVVVPHLLLAWALMVDWQVIKVDALSRTANAYYVFYSSDPHLAALGFNWNPLPALLQLPFFAKLGDLPGIKDLFPVLATHGIAGAIVSTVAGGVGAIYLMRTLRFLGVGRIAAFLLLLAYSLHPMVFFYISNGMSESLFIALIWMCCYLFLVNENQLKSTSLAFLGLAASAAFMARYEGVLIAGVVLLFLMFGEVQRRSSQLRLEGVSIAFFTIPLYVIFFWMLINWTISGSPVTFLEGESVNSAKQMMLPQDVKSAAGSLIGTVNFVLPRIVALSPAWLLLALPVGIWAAFNLRLVPLALVLIWGIVPLYEALLLYFGASLGYSRYFLYVIPGAIVLAGYLIGRYRGRLSGVVQTLAAGLILISPVANFVGLQSDALPDELPFAQWLTRGGQVTAVSSDYVQFDPELVSQLDAIPGPILLDTYLGYATYLQVRDPKAYIITSDRTFRDALNNPRSNVRYILVPRPQGLGAIDLVNIRWPRLYAGGEEWATLAREFKDSGYRLYRVRNADS